VKTIINKLVPYIMAVLVFCIFNSVVYSYLIYNQKKEYNLLLKGYADITASLLEKDLKNAFNSSLPNSKEFFLFKDFQVIPRSKPGINLIIVTPDVIKVKTPKEEYIFDSHNLKNIIKKIFPSFITYELSFNNYSILADENQNSEYSLTQSSLIGSNDTLALKSGIKKDSAFYLDKQHLLQKNILISGIGSFLILSALLYFYLRVSSKIKRRFSILEQEIYEEREINLALLNNDKADHHLKKLFIKKLTEMYLKQELGEAYDSNSILPKNPLFPIHLTDLSLTKIDIENLTKLLQEYFAPYFAKIGLRITSSIKNIEINCSTPVFYQLIFSLIFNLVKFMDRQSNIPQILKINFNQDKITIVNDCFPLDERKMIKLSDIIIEEYMDVFILNCHKIFKSLKEHKFKYNIFSHGNSYIIEIIYPPLDKSNTSNKGTGQIIDFTKYWNNRN